MMNDVAKLSGHIFQGVRLRAVLESIANRPDVPVEFGGMELFNLLCRRGWISEMPDGRLRVGVTP